MNEPDGEVGSTSERSAPPSDRESDLSFPNATRRTFVGLAALGAGHGAVDTARATTSASSSTDDDVAIGYGEGGFGAGGYGGIGGGDVGTDTPTGSTPTPTGSTPTTTPGFELVAALAGIGGATYLLQLRNDDE